MFYVPLDRKDTVISETFFADNHLDGTEETKPYRTKVDNHQQIYRQK